MIASPFMLVPAAERAGLAIPHLDDKDEFDAAAFPHFAVYCTCQLGRPTSPEAHWTNAEIIAGIPEAEIRKVTYQDILDRGFVI